MLIFSKTFKAAVTYQIASYVSREKLLYWYHVREHDVFKEPFAVNTPSFSNQNAFKGDVNVAYIYIVIGTDGVTSFFI